MHFAISNHGTLTLVEPLTDLARQFFRSLGIATAKLAVTYRDLRELRYAARAAGLAM